MSNMNYCMFENTASDLHDCVEKIDALMNGDQDVEQLSSYDRKGLEDIMDLAVAIVDMIPAIDGKTKVDKGEHDCFVSLSTDEMNTLCDAINTYHECGMTPSELLVRVNELNAEVKDLKLLTISLKSITEQQYV